VPASLCLKGGGLLTDSTRLTRHKQICMYLMIVKSLRAKEPMVSFENFLSRMIHHLSHTMCVNLNTFPQWDLDQDSDRALDITTEYPSWPTVYKPLFVFLCLAWHCGSFEASAASTLSGRENESLRKNSCRSVTSSPSLRLRLPRYHRGAHDGFRCLLNHQSLQRQSAILQQPVSLSRQRRRRRR
jgi:hypothetical protein